MQSSPTLCLAAWGAAAGAAAIFDNFGPNQSFDTAAAEIGPGPTGVIEFGFAFISAASGLVAGAFAALGLVARRRGGRDG